MLIFKMYRTQKIRPKECSKTQALDMDFINISN